MSNDSMTDVDPKVRAGFSGTVLTFPRGILGFARELTFQLSEGEYPGLYLLQGAEPGTPSFLVVDPFVFFEGFAIEVDTCHIDELEASHAAQIGVLAITVPDPESGVWTANLQGPLVINVARSLGFQIVLQDSAWSIRQPFRPFPQPAARATQRSPEEQGASVHAGFDLGVLRHQERIDSL